MVNYKDANVIHPEIILALVPSEGEFIRINDQFGSILYKARQVCYETAFPFTVDTRLTISVYVDAVCK